MNRLASLSGGSSSSPGVARSLFAVAATPGWEVIGAFTPASTASAPLDVIGAVSDASLTLRVRLYCVTAGSVGVVADSTVSITSTVDLAASSASLALTGGRTYQYQAEVTGNAGAAYFGTVRSARWEP